ncbi:MAG: hypothetical protein SVK54_06860 [candidate division WOR-3 bacterium]|nr:hypothetical protein [candidate division WOR-3 bacterium]
MKKIFSLAFSILILTVLIASASSDSGSLSVSIIIPPIYNEVQPAAPPPLKDTSSLPSSIHSVEVAGCFIKEGTYILRVFNNNEKSDTVNVYIRIYDREEGISIKDIHINAFTIEANAIIRITVPLIKDNNLTVFSTLVKEEHTLETSVCRI